MTTRCEEIRALLDPPPRVALSAAATQSVEAHAAVCGECSRDREARLELVTRLPALPATIEPPRDLWPGIAPRLRGRRARRAMPGIAAAAALVLLSSGITWLATRRPRPEVTPSAAVAAIAADYAPELASLSEVLEAGRGRLAPRTIAIVERNLAEINRAIAESRAALAADPADRDLELLLRASYGQKVALLEQAARLAEGT